MDVDEGYPKINNGHLPVGMPNSSPNVDMEDGLFMQCTNCKGKFDDFEYDKIHFLDQCCHIVCKK